MTTLREHIDALLEHRGAPRLRAEAPAGRSLVAGANAIFRQVEAERPAGERIVHDPLARHFAETHWAVGLVRLLRHLIPPLRRELEQLQVAHCVRHRAVDGLVGRALDEAFGQVVVVGAGYDTRAHRMGRPGVRWFELDHAATGRAKLARLRRAGHAPWPAEQVHGELVEEGLASAMTTSSLEAARPACYVLEGLIHYLPPKALDALLADIADGGGRRRVVVSYIDPDMVERTSSTFVTLVKALREVPRHYYRPGELDARLGAAGFDCLGHWLYARQVDDFAPQARRRPVGVSQHVALYERGEGDGGHP